MRLRRRDFLQAIVVTAAAVPFSGCGSDDDGGGSTAADPDAEFPQGLASGDPKPDSVVLWTRAVPVSGSGSVKVRYEVALDEAFESMVAQGSVSVTEDSDWTVRIKPVGLEPYTQYYYRFKAGKMVSDVGRTKTAPTADQDVNVRFAFASCQDFIGRYYHSWKAFLEQEEPVDFVVWLGDYIYETNGDPDFQLNDPNRKIDIQDGIQLLPDSDPTVKAASSLADYRGIYKQYRADENLRKAHQMFPFITIWDDHEFANDCWQDHSTDFNEAKGEEKNTPRREAASQAWFEYQAADVDWDAAAAFPNDLTIYRTLRYGKHVELILTDQRSYRSDHVIPEAATGGQKPEGAPASQRVAERSHAQNDQSQDAYAHIRSASVEGQAAPGSAPPATCVAYSSGPIGVRAATAAWVAASSGSGTRPYSASGPSGPAMSSETKNSTYSCSPGITSRCAFLT